MKEDSKPVDLITLNGFKHDGVHYGPGDVLTGVAAELAFELTGAGRTRLADAGEVAAAQKAAPKKQAGA